MANGGRIDFTVGYKVDKTGLNDLKSSLTAVGKLMPSDLVNLNIYSGSAKEQMNQARSDFMKMKLTLSQVEEAFDNAFDSTTGITNLQKLNQSLNNIGIEKLSQQFNKFGEVGQNAFYQIAKASLTTKMQLKENVSLLDKMGQTLINTLKWSISSSIINKFTGSIRQAYGYVQHLDTSLNDIRIVTGKSADEMDKFAVKANDAAKALGASTTEYTEAALIYYQQGLSDEESQARAETTLKAANVTGQTGKEVSEQLTAVWNGYKVSAEETELYVDKLAAVAATTASDLEELSTGMSKVASAANAMGVDVDQLNGMLSTIISVTRQAPETAGTALKTIFARIEDLKISGEDEDGVKLGEVSSTLDEVGVHIMDVNGDIRDLGEVIEEVAGKWDTWTDAQQTAIAQAMAGKRQYNNLLALFNNWDMYSDAVETSRNSMGTLQEQQDIYMESTAAHLQQLKTEWEDFYDSLLDNGTINDVLDGLSKAIGLLNNFMDGIGGGNNALLMLGSTALRVFSKQFGEGIKNVVLHFSRLRNNAKELQAQLDNIQLFKNSSQYQNNEAVRALVDAQEQVSKYYNVLNQEQINTANALAQQVGDAKLLEQQWKKDVDALNEYQRAMQKTYGSAKFVDDNKKRSQQSTGKYDFASTDPGSKLDQAAVQNFQRSQKELENYRKSVAGLNKDYVLLAKSSKNMWKSTKDINNQDKDVKKLRTAIKNVQDSAKECLKSFTKLRDTGLFKDADINNINKVELALYKVATAKSPDEYIQAMEELNLAGKAVGKTAEELLNDFQRLHEQGNKINFNAPFEKLQAFLKEAQIHQFATGIIKVIGATGQLASGINSLKNAFDVLGDSELTASEKILQFMSSAGMGITMIANSIGALSEGASKVAGAIMTVIAKKIGLVKADGTVVTAETAEKIAMDLGTSSIWAQVAAWVGLDAAMAPVLAIMTAIIAVIAAATAVILVQVKAHKDAIEAIQAHNKEVIQYCENAKQEIESNKEIANSLQTLINQYKEGTISAEEFYNQRNKMLAGLDAEGRAALNVAGSWEIAQKALDRYLLKQSELAEQNAEKEIKATFSQAFSKVAEKGGNYSTGEKESEGRENVVDRMLQKGYQFEDFAFVDEAGGMTLTPKDYQTYLDLIEVMKQLQAEGREVPKSWIKGIEIFESSEEYKTLTEDIDTVSQEKEYQAGVNSGINYAQTIEEGQAAYEEFKRTLIEDEGYTLQQANDAWINYISGLDTKIAAEMAQTQQDFDKMTASFATKYQGDFNTSKFKENAERIQQMLKDENLSDGITLFEPEEWESMIISWDDEQIKQAVSEKLEKNFKEGFNSFKESAGQYEDDLQTVITQAISGKVETDEDSSYAKLKDHIADLIEYYPELTDQANTFLNESIIGTEKWTQAVYDLQAAFDALELDKLTENYSKDLEKLHNQIEQIGKQETVYDDKGFATSKTIVVEPDTQKFTETVEQIMSDDYSINMEIHADITDDFDNLVSSMDKMDSMASKIGEDFIVSADDITELAESYPGILEGYTDLGNGTIQLNEEIAKSAMNAASEAEIASTEELKTEIENTNKKLRVKQNHYKTIIDLATKGAEDEANAEEYKNKIVTELDEIEVINNDLKTQEIVDNALSVADDSAQNAQIVSQNWESAYQNMADASEKAAQVAIENAKQVVAANKGEDASAVHGDVKTNWSGETGNKTTIDTTTPNMKQAEESNKEYFDRMKKMAQDNYDALEKEINANEAMKVEAVAKLGKSVDINTNTGRKKEDSSSSASKKEAQHEDYLEREVDLYHDINLELKQIESTLGRIQKQNSYKWGKDLQEGLKRENKLLDKQLEKLQEKSRIQQKDIAQRRANLEAQGFQFSKDGSSTKNAEGVLDKLYAEYNSMVDTYNSMSADQQEEYKKQLEAKKKDIDKTENDLKNYESLFGEYQSMLDELQDLHYKQIENAVERFNNMVDVHLELDEAKKEWNDFWYEIVKNVDDTDFGGKIAQSMGKLKTLIGIGGNANKSQIAELTRHLEDTTTEVNAQIASRKHGGEDSLFEDATKLSKENLEKYRDQLMDAVREAKEEVDNIAENYIKILESAQDLIDKQVEGLESIGDHLEHNIELFKMVEGAQAYEPIIRQYQKLYQNDLNLLDTQRQNKEFWAEQIDRYEKLLAVTEKGSVEWKTYSDSMDKAVQNYRKAVQELDKTLQDTLKHAEELYKEQTEKAFKDLDKEISQGYGMDMVEEEWNLINELSSRYLDNVEKALEIEIYTNDLEKAAKATGLSVKNQEKLNKFKDEEIKKLKEKEKLTQYDIDESRARLAIMQAEMALEDQRANKSKMRLRRDNQGNYSYQYVADEQPNEDGENGVLTAKKEWYELVKKRDKEVYDNRIELSKKWMQYLEEANEAEKNKDYEKAAFLRGLAQEVQDELKQNNEEINKNTQDLISGTAQFFSDVENASVLPTSETVAATLVNDMEKVGTAGEKAVIKLGQIQDEYIDNTDKAIKQAGIEWEEYRDEGIDPTDESLKELVDTQEELDEKLNTVNEQLTTQEGNLRACEEAYLALKDAAVDAIESANSALEQLAKTAITTQQQVAASVAASQAAARASSSVSSSASNAGNGTATASSSGVPYILGPDPDNQSGVFGVYNRNANGSRGEYTGTRGVPSYLKQVYGPDYKKKVQGLKTGGYTGDWAGSDGKLAFLHQKELVLNEADTSNLLKAIYVLRQAVASFNFNQLADSLVYSTAKWRNQMTMQSMMSDRANMVNSITNDTNNDYKNITVNADFTGVRSADAIYQALVELENYGMQQNYSSAPHNNTSY